MKKLIILFAVFFSLFGLVACSDDDVENGITWPVISAPAAGNIKLAIYLGDVTALPAGNNVYMIGDFAGFTNAASSLPLNVWTGGTAADRYEPGLMTKVSDKLYTIELVPPVTNYSLDMYMKFVNNEGTIEVDDLGDIGASWENVGNMLTGTDSNLISWAAGVMTGCANTSAPDLKFQLQNNGSTIVVDLASMKGWKVDTSAVTSVDVALTINWTGVPASHTKGALWADLTDGNAVLTGSETWMHTDGTSVWSPALGKALTVTLPTATITTTVPTGRPCAFTFKFANLTGWDNGEENADQAGFVNPDLASQSITVPFGE